MIDWVDESLTKLERRLLYVRARRDALSKEIKRHADWLDGAEERDKELELARRLIQEVAVETQSELEFHLSHVASLALEAVFDDPYELGVEFVPKRGRSEAYLTFYRDGEQFDPLEDTAGGAVDLASFAMRLSLLMLQKRLRPILVLDEVFQNVSKDLYSRLGKVVLELSKELGVQMLVVSHESDLAAEITCTAYHVERKGKVSTATKVTVSPRELRDLVK